jgi:hypothetical protein
VGIRVCAVICLFACSSDPGGVSLDAAPMPDAGPPSAVDILFLIDDSSNENVEQQNLSMNLPVLINALHNAPSGAPDLHISITTSSMGAGAFTSSVPGCTSPDMGRFVTTARSPADPTACSTNRLNAGERFFIDGAQTNYSGDLAIAVGCLLQAGSNGCGFEHHLSAIRAALGDPANGIAAPDSNAGFRRANARLALIILGDEDDCSAPSDSLLFDPSQNSLSDALGPLASFRCTEFGITCDGLTANNGRIPRVAGGPYQNCRSNDAYAAIDPSHSLVPAQVFIDYLHRMSDVVVADISAPADPFSTVVDQQTNFPELQFSCTSTNGTFGAPAVRTRQVVASLGSHGLVSNVCQNSYSDALARIADLILTP